MAEKSKDAFRTISEVADWLDVPTHVLRFWESRFAQIKPVKRAGGRRYYRPSDMRVIGGVKVLLHDQGMTIRGVQKLFREEGVKHVASFAPALFDAEEEDAPLDAQALERAARPAPAARSTRDAEPAVEASDADLAAVAEEETPTPVFRRTSTPAPAHFAADEPQLDFLPSSEKTEADTPPPEPAEAPMPILVGPDVPETDPEDDDGAHDVGPGHAAQLRLVARQRLEQDRPRIEAVVARLKIVLDRSA